MKALTFDDVLLTPAYNHHNSRKDVDISMTDKTGKLTMSLPVFSSNMDTITEHEMANYMSDKGGLGIIHRFMSIEENVSQFLQSPPSTFVSVGCSDSELQRFKALAEVGAKNFCVDVAHGHAKYVGKMIKKMKDIMPECIIMAGNVATYAGADYLASCGADIIKVGLGPGANCSTRLKTGFGVPQLTAIKECAKIGKSIVADGGIRTPGDIVKALAFGADFVMLGRMLAGTSPTPGEVHTARQLAGDPHHPVQNTTQHKIYRGMASKEVADEKLGGLSEWKTAEGVQTVIEYKDKLATDSIIHDIVGGLRSGLTYGGAINIRELQRKLNYTVITTAGLEESKTR